MWAHSVLRTTYFMNDKIDPQRGWIIHWDHSGCKCQSWVLNAACVTTEFVLSTPHCTAASHRSHLAGIPNTIVVLGHGFRPESLPPMHTNPDLSFSKRTTLACRTLMALTSKQMMVFVPTNAPIIQTKNKTRPQRNINKLNNVMIFLMCISVYVIVYMIW